MKLIPTLTVVSLLGLSALFDATPANAQNQNQTGNTSNYNNTGNYSNTRNTGKKTRMYAEDNSKNMEDSSDLRQSIMNQDLGLYRANEWSVDVFGTYAVTESSGRYRDGLGGGVGVNYFFTRYVGIGLEGYAWDGNTEDAVGALAGNLILRLPLDKCGLAPYIFAGPSGHFGPITEFSGQAGGGLEYRFNQKIGVFTDARYVFTSESNDYFLPRLGVRFVF